MAKPKPTFRPLSRFKPREVEWFWRPYIPAGMITIMEGDPGEGKSFLAMFLAAMVSVGGKLPDGSQLELGTVLYISAEDDPSYTIRPRVDAMVMRGMSGYWFPTWRLMQTALKSFGRNSTTMTSP